MIRTAGPGSAVAELAMRGRWTLDQHLAAAQTNALNHMLWLRSGANPKYKPVQILCPCCDHEDRDEEHIKGDVLPVEEMAARLAGEVAQN